MQGGARGRDAGREGSGGRGWLTQNTALKAALLCSLLWIALDVTARVAESPLFRRAALAGAPIPLTWDSAPQVVAQSLGAAAPAASHPLRAAPGGPRTADVGSAGATPAAAAPSRSTAAVAASSTPPGARNMARPPSARPPPSKVSPPGAAPAPPAPRLAPEATSRPFDNDTTLHYLFGDAFDPGSSVGDDEIVVLGMHNSGTSITTRMLALLGAFMGNAADVMLSEINPLKYYERWDVARVNNALLTPYADSNFWQWHAQNFSLGNVKGMHALKFKQGAQAVLSDLRRHPPLVVKDPRMCLVMDLWRPLLQNPFCVIVTADAARIAAHLATNPKALTRTKGLKMTAERFMDLWEASLYHAVRGCVGAPSIMFFTEDMRPDNVLDHVRALLDALTAAGVRGLLMPSASEVDRKIVAFFNTNAHRHSGDEGPEPPRAPMTVRQAALQGALEYYAKSDAAKLANHRPAELAGLILAKARRDMGETAWAQLTAQYPPLHLTR